jgi:hypothetical protein
MLKRYDLCEQAAWRMRAMLVTLNAGHEWLKVEDAKHKLVAAVMGTRPGLEIEEAKRMVDALFEAND